MFALNFQQKDTGGNNTFIYRKKNRSKFVRFIYLGNTIYKLFFYCYLYYCCIFDYSQVYKKNTLGIPNNLYSRNGISYIVI